MSKSIEQQLKELRADVDHLLNQVDRLDADDREIMREVEYNASSISALENDLEDLKTEVGVYDQDPSTILPDQFVTDLE